MKSLVIFDSNFGNTKAIAEAIAKSLKTTAKSVSDTKPGDLTDLDLIVVGSPINGWRPSEKMGAFLSGLEPGQLDGKLVAAFDTRVKLFIHGDAMTQIEKALVNLGAKPIVGPTQFYVGGKEGPLLDGELVKAGVWANKIKQELEK